MSIAKQTKDKINKLIYERAYEIESELSKDEYFLAKMVGINPEQIEDVSLKVAIKELQKQINHE